MLNKRRRREEDLSSPVSPAVGCVCLQLPLREASTVRTTQRSAWSRGPNETIRLRRAAQRDAASEKHERHLHKKSEDERGDVSSRIHSLQSDLKHPV